MVETINWSQCQILSVNYYSDLYVVIMHLSIVRPTTPMTGTGGGIGGGNFNLARSSRPQYRGL